jgi:hypothetical protein
MASMRMWRGVSRLRRRLVYRLLLLGIFGHTEPTRNSTKDRLRPAFRYGLLALTLVHRAHTNRLRLSSAKGLGCGTRSPAFRMPRW